MAELSVPGSHGQLLDADGGARDGREIGDRAAPPLMTDVDFGDALFDQVEFLGLMLDHVTIPRDPDVRLVSRYRGVVEHALALLDGDSSLPARMLRGEFQNRLRMMRAAQEDNFFNRRDYAASGGDEFGDAGESGGGV